MEHEIKARVSRFVQDAEEAFPALDVKHKGSLVKSEIDAAVMNSSVTGHAAETAAMLYKESEDIRKVTGKSSITLDTIKALDGTAFDARLKSCADVPTNFQLSFLNPILWSTKITDEINNDRNAPITKDQLVKDGESGQFLATHFSDIQKLNGSPADKDEVNSKSIANYMLGVDANCGPIFNINGMYKRTQQLNQPEISRALFGLGDKPLDSIRPEAVKQGVIGNCQFEATLAEVAVKDPASIARMIHENADGSCTVTFPGAPDSPMTVSKPTDAELMLFNGPSKYGVWASVVEKAFAQYELQKSGASAEGASPQAVLDKGATPEEALQILTGRPATRVDWVSDPRGEDALRAALIDAQKNKNALVGGIDNFQNLASGNFDIPAGHAYSILDFDTGGVNGGTLTLLNSWGKGAGPRGKFLMSFDEFKKVFSRVYAA